MGVVGRPEAVAAYPPAAAAAAAEVAGGAKADVDDGGERPAGMIVILCTVDFKVIAI